MEGGGGSAAPMSHLLLFLLLKKACFIANLPIIMQTHSEFSEKPIVLKTDRQTDIQTYCSVSREVSSKYIIIDYWTILKKVLERLCSNSIQTDRQTDRQINCQISNILASIILFLASITILAKILAPVATMGAGPPWTPASWFFQRCVVLGYSIFCKITFFYPKYYLIFTELLRLRAYDPRWIISDHN